MCMTDTPSTPTKVCGADLCWHPLGRLNTTSALCKELVCPHFGDCALKAAERCNSDVFCTAFALYDQRFNTANSSGTFAKFFNASGKHVPLKAWTAYTKTPMKLDDAATGTCIIVSSRGRANHETEE